eukprot:1162064-Pelagomonas_calceolata.AAC.7
MAGVYNGYNGYNGGAIRSSANAAKVLLLHECFERVLPALNSSTKFCCITGYGQRAGLLWPPGAGCGAA